MLKRLFLAVGVMVALMLGSMSTATADGLLPPSIAERTYISLFGGYMAGHDTDFDFSRGTISASDTFDFDGGFRFGGALGFIVIDGVRLELEATHAFTEISADNITVLNNGVPAGVLDHVEADVTITTLMVNGLYDVTTFKVTPNLIVTPYVGAGVGVAWWNIDHPLDAFDWTESELAGQVLAGVTVPLNDNVAIRAGYRFLVTGGLEDRGFNTDRFYSHSVEGGVNLRF